MTNQEHSLLKLKDPRFYCESFFKIKGKVPGLMPLKLNPAQLDLFNALNHNPRVIICKARQIGFCLDKDTRILSSDLRWIKAGDIQPGQEIVSVDEMKAKGRGSHRKMKLAIVQKKWTVFEEAFLVKVNNGESFIATGKHRFLAKKWECSTDTVWREVENMKIGDSIRYITKTWGEPDYEDGWFSGIIDGEGSLCKKSRTGSLLTVSQVDGPVWDRIVSYADKKGFDYRVEHDKRTAGDSSKLGTQQVNKLVIGQMGDLFKVLGQTRPARMIKRLWWNDKTLPQAGWGKIISIEPLGKREMFDIQTSEKTFIAEGFVSHNSTAVCAYLYHKTITTPGTNTALIGYNSELTAEFLDKVKTFYRTTPDALKPQVQYNSRHEISFPAIDSKIIVLPSTENVGRGYTLHNCLLENTTIYLRNGEQKRISDIKNGDFVLNGNGGFSEVLEVTKKETSKKMLEIDVVQGGKLTLTEDHLILSRGKKENSFKPEWKPASQVNGTDYIAIPYRQCRNRKKEVEIPQPPTLFRGGSTFFPEIKSIPVTRELGLLMGWYLAEGWSGKNKVCFCIHEDEVPTLSNLIEDVFGGLYKGGLSVQYKGHGAIITINSYVLSRFFKLYLPGRAWEKTIPDSFWYWGWDFNKGLLEGIILGDGYTGDKSGIRITTTSEKLANQIRMMMISLRLGVASIYKSKSSRYGISSRDRYDVCLSGNVNWKVRHVFGFEEENIETSATKYKTSISTNINLRYSRYRRGTTHYWLRIRGIKEVETPKYVYDLVLDGEPHSFMTQSGVVHNCLLSELAFWDKAEEKMLAIENAVPRNGTIVIESTPSNIGNLYHRMWMADNGYVKKQYGWWWHYTEEEIEVIRKRINDPQKFAQEYSLEFMATGRSVFATDLLKAMQAGIFVMGQEIKDEEGRKYTVFKGLDELVIYFTPRLDHKYVVGVDVAEGVTGGDYSVVTIWDRNTGDEVAHWRGHRPPDVLATILNRWGRYYHDAMMVVEINNHGLTTVTGLKNLLYPQMYFRPMKFDGIGSTWSEHMGWRTTNVTKPLMIDELHEALRGGSLKIHTEETLKEMLTFIYDNANNMTAQDGFHDDSIMSCAIAFQGFKVISLRPTDQIPYEQHLPSSFTY